MMQLSFSFNPRTSFEKLAGNRKKRLILLQSAIFTETNCHWSHALKHASFDGSLASFQAAAQQVCALPFCAELWPTVESILLLLSSDTTFLELGMSRVDAVIVKHHDLCLVHIQKTDFTHERFGRELVFDLVHLYRHAAKTDSSHNYLGGFASAAVSGFALGLGLATIVAVSCLLRNEIHVALSPVLIV